MRRGKRCSSPFRSSLPSTPSKSYVGVSYSRFWNRWVGRFWGHFQGMYRQKLTKSPERLLKYPTNGLVCPPTPQPLYLCPSLSLSVCLSGWLALALAGVPSPARTLQSFVSRISTCGFVYPPLYTPSPSTLRSTRAVPPPPPSTRDRPLSLSVARALYILSRYISRPVTLSPSSLPLCPPHSPPLALRPSLSLSDRAVLLTDQSFCMVIHIAVYRSRFLRERALCLSLSLHLSPSLCPPPLLSVYLATSQLPPPLPLSHPPVLPGRLANELLQLAREGRRAEREKARGK